MVPAPFPSRSLAPGVRLRAPLVGAQDPVLTPEAVAFVAEWVRRWRPRVGELLAERGLRLAAWRSGQPLDFDASTAELRASDWRCAPVPEVIADRRVEITGPVDRKMVINALNSGAKVFMADFEDANAPTWANCIEGQLNLSDAVRGTIEYTAETGKQYRLGPDPAVLFVRPRGLHLLEAHLEVNGEPAPACLVDAGLYLFHNGRELAARGRGPFLYLPKMEAAAEAAFWNAALAEAEAALGLARGAVKVTCLIETLPGAFAMDELLFELRERSAGLNCGRWDYIFSYIKVHAEDGTRVLPDRAQVGMTQPFLEAYTRHLIRTCHRRGVHAMGGMAAQIPVKGDEAANAAAFEKVRQDKLREVLAGHDGTWVAHPALVPVAREVFDTHMPAANQIAGGAQADFQVSAELLHRPPEGTRTEAGLRQNLSVGVMYLAAWLGGSGAVPLHRLMEDAATAEISRSQVWQWLRHGAKLDDGRSVDRGLVERLLAEELSALEREQGTAAFAAGHVRRAAELFVRVAVERPLADFLTLPAYDTLLEIEAQGQDAPPPTEKLP